MDGCHTGPFPSFATLFVCDIHVFVIFFPDVCLRVLVIFSPFLASSLFVSSSKCIHTKKWIKAPNFLAYNRKWYAACRIGIGRRGISTELCNAYFVKLYEKLRKKWRNVVISVWIGRDHNYLVLIFFLFLFLNALFRWGILDLVFFFFSLFLSFPFSLPLILFISHIRYIHFLRFFFFFACSPY